jgi:hypothetical protein
MFAWGLCVFIGLIVVYWDLPPIVKAWLNGHPMLIHVIVLSTGFWLHGGSAVGAMAAVVSGIFSGLFFRCTRHFHGYLDRKGWHPGTLRRRDPRVRQEAT